MLRSLYIRSVVVDGNFKLDNLKMKKADEDVALSDGEAFFVGDVQYKEHLRQAVELKEVSAFTQIQGLLLS
jgi:hypothetical protein